MTPFIARSFTALWNSRGDFRGSTKGAFIRLKMAKTLTLAAFLVCISCVLADSSSFVVTPSVAASASQTTSVLSPTPSSSTHTSPSSSPRAMVTSTTAAPSTSSMMSSSPTPSPTPAPPIIPDNNYLFPRDGPVCIHLKAGIEANVAYVTANETRTALLKVSGNATVVTNTTADPTSMCNDTHAKLVLTWSHNKRDYNYLTFAFKATNTSWTEEGMTLKYALADDSIFPDYIGLDNYTFGVATFGDLLEGRNTNNNNKSFICNTSQTFSSSDTHTGNTTNVTMIVQDLQMQAFYFSNSTGEFDEGFDCAANESNKIVPIVVGAALAGLVIVVLIAYLIGRFRNRKQSSYEALS